MDMKKTEKGTKKFTDEEKLSIIAEAQKNGVKITLEKYDLYPATYYYWKKQLKLSSPNDDKELRIKIKKLTKENLALKELLAETQLASKLKDDLLKKKYPSLKR